MAALSGAGSGAGKGRFNPALPPNAERHDDACLLELLEALRQKRGRHAGHAAPEIVETRGTIQQLAQKQRGPARTDDFRRHGHGAKLSVAPEFGFFGQMPLPRKWHSLDDGQYKNCSANISRLQAAPENAPSHSRLPNRSILGSADASVSA